MSGNLKYLFSIFINSFILYQPTDPNTVAVSALHGLGMEELKKKIEEAVLQATGRLIRTIQVELAGPQLSWLYKEATVQGVDVLPEDGLANSFEYRSWEVMLRLYRTL
eukprot:g34267.t1